ncbi:MAG TPA: tetratricopeptide repeat protein, partial [Chitinophagales bacterium]|nr:tetratricopeptide repeat protein [Chitinophagales bacterium]
EYIDSWENVEGEAGMHPSEQREDPWAAKEAMNQLVELGYIEAPGENQQKNIEKITRESKWYLARVFMYKKQYEKAIELLEEIYGEEPEIRYGLSLIRCYQQLRDVVKFRDILDKVRKSDSEANKMVQLDMLEGALLLLEYKPRKALQMLLKAEESAGHMSQLHVQIGKIYLRSQHLDDAERAFVKALAIDSQNATAHQGLGGVYLRQGKYEEAAESALNAIGLLYYYPIAHYYLAEALMNLGEYEKAAEAFEVCCAVSPGNRKAHLWLIRLYEDHLKKPEKAEEHRRFIQERIKGVITIVSGLPRSGTSMMMQMLKAGGAEIVTDDIRQPDNNNPKGYWEYEKVKKMMSDTSWMEEANNKTLKIIAPLLTYLPVKYDYKIIFMQRDIAEVMKSQQVMLGRKSEVQQNAFPIVLSEAFKKQTEQSLAWIKRSPNVSVLFVEYADAIERPEEVAENVAEFLGEELDISKMVEAVDKSLYRNKFVEKV